MDRAYRSAINTAGSQRDAIRDAQRAFIKQRRACGSSIDCIGNLYRSRLTQLRPGQTRFGGKSVVAPSFNCATDRGPDEQAICRDATLSHLDDEMDRAYSSAINTAGSQRDAIRDTQRAFLQQRRSCGSSADCIGSLYRSRLMQLQPGQTRFGGQVVKEPASCPVFWMGEGKYKYCFCGDKNATVAQLASDGTLRCPGLISRFRCNNTYSDTGRCPSELGCILDDQKYCGEDAAFAAYSQTHGLTQEQIAYFLRRPAIPGVVACGGGYCRLGEKCWQAPTNVGTIERGEQHCLSDRRIADYEKQILADQRAEMRRKREAADARKTFGGLVSTIEQKEIDDQIARLGDELHGRDTNLASRYAQGGRTVASEVLYRRMIEALDFTPSEYLEYYLPPVWVPPGRMSNRLSAVLDIAYPGLIKALIMRGQLEEALEYAERGRSKHLQAVMQRNQSNRSASDYFSRMSISNIRTLASDTKTTFVFYASPLADTPQSKPREIYAWVVQPGGQVDFQTLDVGSLVDNKEPYSGDPVGAAVSIFTRTLARGVVDRVLNSKPSRGEQASAGDQGAVLRALHRVLVDKLEKYLPKDPDENVVIVPDGSLFLVPFAALLEADGTYLVERHTISVVPSLGIWALLHNAQSGQTGSSWLGSSLVIGNPLMPAFPSGVDLANAGLRDVQIPQLPGAETEATVIASLLKTKPLVGGEATEEEVTKQMKVARLIHLATHGLLIQSAIMIDEMLSGSVSADYPPGAIVLAKGAGGKYPDSNYKFPYNGFLASGKVLSFKLNAELVTLSACDTARGRVEQAQFVGLPSAFLAAGVRSVAMTLWSIPDAPTADLMVEFYKELLAGRPKAVALRHAMLSAKQRHPDPVNWGAFVLFGMPD